MEDKPCTCLVIKPDDSCACPSKRDNKPCGCEDCTDSRCSKCPNCFDLSYEKIREYLYAIDTTLVKYSNTIVCLDEWGYGCAPFKKDEVSKLEVLKCTLEDYKQGVLGNYFTGICPDEIQTVIEAVSAIVDLDTKKSENFSDVFIDDSGLAAWTFKNPYCVPYEDWEYCTLKVLPKMGIEVINLSEACKMIYDLQTNVIEEDYRFLYTLKVAQEAKSGFRAIDELKPEFKVTVNEIINKCLTYKSFVKKVDSCTLSTDFKVKLKKCWTDYQLIVSHKTCTFDFKTYLKLLSCNLSHRVISSFLDCNVDLEYSSKLMCPLLVTKNGKYRLSEIKVNEVLVENKIELEKRLDFPLEF